MISSFRCTNSSVTYLVRVIPLLLSLPVCYVACPAPVWIWRSRRRRYELMAGFGETGEIQRSNEQNLLMGPLICFLVFLWTWCSSPWYQVLLIAGSAYWYQVRIVNTSVVRYGFVWGDSGPWTAARREHCCCCYCLTLTLVKNLESVVTRRCWSPRKIRKPDEIKWCLGNRK